MVPHTQVRVFLLIPEHVPCMRAPGFGAVPYRARPFPMEVRCPAPVAGLLIPD
jgi:hypothetical protein